MIKLIYTKLKKIINILILPAMFVFIFFLPVWAFFLSIFVLFLIYKINTKILGVITLLMLISIPILQHYGIDKMAENIATYAYYLIIIIIFLEIFYLFIFSKKNKISELKNIEKEPLKFRFKKSIDGIIKLKK